MTLQDLVNVPESKRDEKWESEFLQAISSANIRVPQITPIQGPDSWPYMLVKTTDNANDQDAEPFQKILFWASDRGIGIAVNADKKVPDYIFTHGMLWSFRETGRYFSDHHPTTGEVEISPLDIKMAGAPTAEYLPMYVRQIIKDFLEQQGLQEPKILVLSTDGQHYDLAFSLESLGNPKEEEHTGIAEALSWFLPPHYTVLLVSEARIGRKFVDLV